MSFASALMTTRLPLLTVILLPLSAIACGATGTIVSPSSLPIDRTATAQASQRCGVSSAPAASWTGVVPESEAIELTSVTATYPGIGTLPAYAPEFDVACLMTQEVYEEDILDGTSRSNPEIVDLERPIWVVQFAAEIRNGRDPSHEPWRYIVVQIDARTGEEIGFSARSEPLF